MESPTLEQNARGRPSSPHVPDAAHGSVQVDSFAKPTCEACGSSEFILSDTVGESVCVECGTVSSRPQVLVNTQIDETGLWFFEGTKTIDTTHGGGTRRARGIRGTNDDNRTIAQENRVNQAKALIASLARVFNVPNLEERACHYYMQSENRRRIIRDRINYVAAASLALVMRDKKRPDTLREIAHAADLSLIRLSRVYVVLQQELGIGMTEVEPVTYIERHIVHLADICKDPSKAVTDTTVWHQTTPGGQYKGTLDWLRSLDMKDVRSVAVRLSAFFSSIHIYHGRHAVIVAVAIVIMALESSSGAKAGRPRQIAEEMCRVYSVASWTAMERYREGQKALLDWSEQLEGIDFSVRELDEIQPGKLKRRMCKRLELALITKDVLDQESSIRDKRLQLGLSAPPPLTVQKVSSVACESKRAVSAWTSTAVTGDEAADVGGTWDELDDDDEDSELEDDPEADPLGPSDPTEQPSPTETGPAASASTSAVPPDPILGPAATSAVTVATSIPSGTLTSNAPHTVSANPTVVSDTPIPTQNQALSSTASTLAASLTTPSLPSDNISQSALPLVSDLVPGSSTSARPSNVASPSASPTAGPSVSPELPTSSLPPLDEDAFFESVLSTISTSGGQAGQTSSSALALLSRTAGALENLDPSTDPSARPGPSQPPLFLPSSTAGSTIAPSVTGHAAPSSNVGYMAPSLASLATLDAAAIQVRSNARNWTPAIGRLTQQFGIPQDDEMMSTISGLIDNPNFGGDVSGTFKNTADSVGMRPAQYMRHRPGDWLRTHPYQHLKPDMLKSIRLKGEAETELGHLILAGHNHHTLPPHLAPHSTLGVIAALRAGGADAVEDDELFIDGELEGYMRPDTEVEFVTKLWEDEGRWEGMEERAARKVVQDAKRARRAAKIARIYEEGDPDELEALRTVGLCGVGRKAGGGRARGVGGGGGSRARGGGARAGKATKATKEMRDKLAALTGPDVAGKRKRGDVVLDDGDEDGEGDNGGTPLRRSKRARREVQRLADDYAGSATKAGGSSAEEDDQENDTMAAAFVSGARGEFGRVAFEDEKDDDDENEPEEQKEDLPFPHDDIDPELLELEKMDSGGLMAMRGMMGGGDAGSYADEDGYESY